MSATSPARGARLPSSIPRTAMVTVSGRIVNLLEPVIGSIEPRDLSEHLAKINRWTGATSLPFSVAQHSILVATYCPASIQPQALLHDAHEAYLGDVITPAVRALEAICPGAQAAMRDLKRRLDFAIYARFNLDWPLHGPVADAIHYADMVAQATEARDLFDPPQTLPHLPPAHPNRIRPMPWGDAAAAFANRLKHYGLT